MPYGDRSKVRSKARWIDQSEKPSRYFCSLENRNFVSKRMVSLVKSNGTEINEFDLITHEKIIHTML